MRCHIVMVSAKRHEQTAALLVPHDLAGFHACFVYVKEPSLIELPSLALPPRSASPRVGIAQDAQSCKRAVLRLLPAHAMFEHMPAGHGAKRL